MSSLVLSLVRIPTRPAEATTTSERAEAEDGEQDDMMSNRWCALKQHSLRLRSAYSAASHEASADIRGGCGFTDGNGCSSGETGKTTLFGGKKKNFALPTETF